MSWRQVILRVPAAEVAAIEARLRLAGAETITLTDAADTPLLEPGPGETPLWPNVVLSALFPAELEAERLEAVLSTSLPRDVELRIETLDDAWQAAAQGPSAPRRFGEGLWLVPAGMETPRPAWAHASSANPPGPGAVTHEAGSTAVALHMGLAFGTGEHPTTALCLEWLDAQGAADATVLDYGCGSGVLALAALALGAERAWAVDNDPQALTATRSNAELNGLQDRLWVGPPEALPEIGADIVLANILAKPLAERAGLFARLLRPGGRIVLSGVLEAQGAEVLEAYAADFADFELAGRGDWLRLAGRRR
ncbi:MAG TPA: 50S ribosomal protein L11 methyltransferase [Gammaproteobacteria bacterium]|nr:50S ribosomal protein L11 methyltransferase [Gammaproteobacteria bacterium]